MPTTGSHCRAAFWMLCTIEVCAAAGTGEVLTGAADATGAWAASNRCLSWAGGAANTLRTATVTAAFACSSNSAILGIVD
jgi:hypothetical protein